MSPENNSDQLVSRRGFLRATGTGAAAVSLTATNLNTPVEAAVPDGHKCLVISLVGGPGQIDTWDPKPDAPEEVRGPFRAIPTTLPGVHFTECFPRLARLAHRLTIVRTLHHSDLAVHETGLQLLHSGAVHRRGVRTPGFGAQLAYLEYTRRGRYVPWFVLPEKVGYLGLRTSHGQDAGDLGPLFEPITLARDLAGEEIEARELRASGRRTLDRALRLAREDRVSLARYGETQFGRSCLIARHLLEGGARYVIVNAYTGVFNQTSWDCHANGYNLPTTLEDYRKTVCPAFDRAFSALIEDLQASGLLKETLVVACGELGRSYRVNHRGGRDHWTGAWSGLLAGGGAPPGAVWGKTDAYGAAPEDRPVPLSELARLISHHLGLPPCWNAQPNRGEARTEAAARRMT